MASNNLIVGNTDKNSSIEVTKNTKGYTKSVKVYFNEETIEDGKAVIERIQEYYKILNVKFPDGV